MTVSTASTIATWVPVALRCLSHHGMQQQEALALAGIDQSKLFQEDARYSVQETRKILALIDKTLDVSLPGLELARFADSSSFGALGYAMMASTTLSEAFNRLNRFAPLVSNVVRMELVVQKPWAEIRIQEGLSVHSTPQTSFDFTMAIMTRFLMDIAGGQAAPRVVHFCHDINEQQKKQYQLFYQCEVKGNQGCYGIFFDQKCLHLSLNAIASLDQSKATEQKLMASLSQLQSNDLPGWLLQRISDYLPNGEPNLHQIAAEMNISGRTLQRRLKLQDVYFKDLVDQSRQKLSQAYLKQGYNVTETAYLLGFADTSSFSRAYRRWFNCPPSLSTSSL